MEVVCEFRSARVTHTFPFGSLLQPRLGRVDEAPASSMVVSGSSFTFLVLSRALFLFRDASVVSHDPLPVALLIELSMPSSQELHRSPVCLPETSLSIHHLLSLDWLADLIACASFSRLTLPFGL
jgi:hypothetical protein